MTYVEVIAAVNEAERSRLPPCRQTKHRALYTSNAAKSKSSENSDCGGTPTIAGVSGQSRVRRCWVAGFWTHVQTKAVWMMMHFRDGEDANVDSPLSILRRRAFLLEQFRSRGGSKKVRLSWGRQ